MEFADVILSMAFVGTGIFMFNLKMKSSINKDMEKIQEENYMYLEWEAMEERRRKAKTSG